MIDRDDGRIDDLDLDSYHADVPGLVADAGDPGHLAVAGLDLPSCEGVLALTDDDEANLAVVQAAALLRPDLPVITRAVSPTTAERMRAFGTPTVVNPFDRFGDHLRIALRAPASYQLMTWLESGPGTGLPPRGSPPSHGHWVICGYGRFGRELLRTCGRRVSTLPWWSPRTSPSTTRTPSSGTATNRGCWPAPGSNAPSGSSPARTTTPPTSR